MIWSLFDVVIASRILKFTWFYFHQSYKIKVLKKIYWSFFEIPTFMFFLFQFYKRSLDSFLNIKIWGENYIWMTINLQFSASSKVTLIKCDPRGRRWETAYRHIYRWIQDERYEGRDANPKFIKDFHWHYGHPFPDSKRYWRRSPEEQCFSREQRSGNYWGNNEESLKISQKNNTAHV